MKESLRIKENIAKADMIAVVRIEGEFDPDGGFSAGPWYTYDAPASSLTASVSGEYTLIIFNDKEERLEVLGFDAEDNFRVITREAVSNPSGALIPVSLVARMSEEASRIAIAKDGQEIYSRSVSKRAPTVAFKDLSHNTELQGKTMVSWEASDEDGNELFFKLYYCADEDQRLLAADIQGTSYEADLTTYPGSSGGYFLIYATNGVRTAEAKSVSFSVRHRAPDIVTVQKEIPKIKITDEIYFKADIRDAQDGQLTGDSVAWILNGEEVASTNVLRTRPYQLEPGSHSFTCVATNSGGATARKEFIFEIIDDESDLPDDWSRREVVNALKKGYATPLVRIEAPIPGGEFIDLMAMLLKKSGTEGFPSENIEPHKSLIHREALKIMYETWALVKNPLRNVKDNEYNENGAREMFAKSGVFDQCENIYMPEEKLSKKSALVWISRLDSVLKQ